MISLTGIYLMTNPPFSSFAIYLSGPPGQVIGGIIGGNVMEADHVFVNAILFKNPENQMIIMLSWTPTLRTHRLLTCLLFMFSLSCFEYF